jgi:hypothetical protein
MFYCHKTTKQFETVIQDKDAFSILHMNIEHNKCIYCTACKKRGRFSS